MTDVAFLTPRELTREAERYLQESLRITHIDTKNALATTAVAFALIASLKSKGS